MPTRRSKALTPPELGSSENLPTISLEDDDENERAGYENMVDISTTEVVAVVLESNNLLLPVLVFGCANEEGTEEVAMEIFADELGSCDVEEWRVG